MNESYGFYFEVYNEMKALFSEDEKGIRGMIFFRQRIDHPLQQFLIQLSVDGGVKMNKTSAKVLASSFFKHGELTTEEEEKILKEIRHVFATCTVMLSKAVPTTNAEGLSKEWVDFVFDFDGFYPYQWSGIEMLKLHYPDFSNFPAEELALLLKFRNAVFRALQIFKAAKNKDLIMSVAAHLEGAQKMYARGGGMGVEVKSRVAIYEREGRIQLQPRPYQTKRAATDITSEEATPDHIPSRSSSLGETDDEGSLDLPSPPPTKRPRL